MPSACQPLDRDQIWSCLSTNASRWAVEISVHAEIDSTNTHLMTRAATQDVDGIVCLAERQTNGRGRRGRTWLTPAGGAIALSLGKRVALPIGEVAPLSLVVGVAVAHALERCRVDAVALKWPNDVLLDGAKVGGILVEISSVAKPLQAIVGVGVNAGAGQSVSVQLGTPVGDIRASNPSVSRNVLAAELINSVHEMISRFEREGFHLIRRAWEALHAHQDRRIRIDGVGEAVFGVARGITDRGELIVETGSGVRYFSSGEVSLRGADGEP